MAFFLLSHSVRSRADGRNKIKPSVKSFAVYAQSRGKGVPPAARAAIRKVQDLVEADRKRGVKVTFTTARIGIEGETKLCADYKDSRAGTEAFQRASVIVKGVDLINLVVEPCVKARP
jgi:hypothetical protein